MYLVLGLGCGRENMLKFWLFFYIVLSPLQSQERKQRDKSRSHVTRSVFKSCSCLFRETQRDLVTKPPPLIYWSQVALNLIISYSLTVTFHCWDSNCDSTNRRLMDIKIKRKKKGPLTVKSILLCPSVMSNSFVTGFSVCGISQARILEWVLTSFSRGSSWCRDRTLVSCIAGKFFTTEPPEQRRQWLPTPVLLPGKSHGWRSLVGCSPWGQEENLRNYGVNWQRWHRI